MVKARKVVRKKRVVRKAPAVEFGKNYYTSQAYDQGMEFAFLAKQGRGYKQACTFVRCKDFLHDAVWARVNREPWIIYSFKYNPTKDPLLDLKHCTLAFRNTQDKNQPERFHRQREGCLDFLNQLEKAMGFAPTRIREIPHADGPCWLIVGDKKWQHAPPLVGLYTLLIRLGCRHSPGTEAQAALEKFSQQKSSGYVITAGEQDGGYLKQGWRGIQVILKHGVSVFHKKMEDNWPPSLGAERRFLHNHFGPVSFSQAATNQGLDRQNAKTAMPYWYRPELWDSE